MKSLFCYIVLFLTLSSFASESFQRFTVLPVVGYSEETELQFGAMGILFLKPSFDGGRVSQLDFAGYGTTRRQGVFLFDPKVYLFQDKINADLKFQYKNWRSRFFGIGNDSDYDNYSVYMRESFFSLGLIESRIGLPEFFQPFRYGISYHVEYNEIQFEEDFSLSDKSSLFGLGYHLSFDNRDNINWPIHGFYFQWENRFYNDKIGDFDFNLQELDLRGYTYLFWKTSMAVGLLWQRSDGDVPFYMLAGPDGIKRFRGVESRYFSDNQALIVQTEFRKELFWRLAGNIFFEGGKSGPYFSQLLKNKWHQSIGFGGQLLLNKKEKVYVRGDISWVDFEHPGLTVYIREAF